MRFISTKAHTVIGLVVGAALLIAPWLFGFSDNSAATNSAIWVGVVVLLSELVSTSPYSILKLVPMKAHVVMDVLVGVFLLLTPWLFSFMDSAANNQWLPHVVVGVLIAGYALLTRTNDAEASIVE